MDNEEVLGIIHNIVKDRNDAQSLSDASFKTFDTLAGDPAFDQFLIKGKALKKGKIVKLPKLAETLKHLAEAGLDDFYRGETAAKLAAEQTLMMPPLPCALRPGVNRWQP